MTNPNPVPPTSVDGFRARAILEPGDRQVWTYDRTTDVRSAIARGLKEYLEPMSIVWNHGRLLTWRNFELVWAEPEVPAEYPSGSLIGEGPGTYDSSQFSPELFPLADGTDRHLKIVCEFVQTFSLVIWATDPEERKGLTTMVEDALNPADFMYGLRLELPFYFNARATYEPVNVIYDDDKDEVQRRWRRAVVSIVGNVSQIVPAGKRVQMRPRLDFRVD